MVVDEAGGHAGAGVYYRSHVTRCEQGAQKSPPTSRVDKLSSKADGTKVEVRIIIAVCN